MLPFSTLILRSYYQAIGWNQDNSYSQLNRSSNGIYPFPDGEMKLTFSFNVHSLFVIPLPSLMSSRRSLDMLGLTNRDFQIPQSLILQLSNAPTPIFFTSYTLDALPQLNGSVSYITTSDVLERVSPLPIYTQITPAHSGRERKQRNNGQSKGKC
jgi:distribution and morphology protein 10